MLFDRAPRATAHGSRNTPDGASGEFAELGGWEAESDVSRMIQGLGLSEDILTSEMSSLRDSGTPWTWGM